MSANKITVAGIHRNATLAARSLPARIKKFGAVSGRIVARRNENGKFSNRGRRFVFELTLPARTLWKYVVGITFPFNTTRGGGYFSFVGRWWKARREQTATQKENFKGLVVKRLAESLGYSEHELWFGRDAEEIEDNGILNTEGPDAETFKAKRYKALADSIEYENERTNVQRRFRRFKERGRVFWREVRPLAGQRKRKGLSRGMDLPEEGL